MEPMGNHELKCNSKYEMFFMNFIYMSQNYFYCHVCHTIIGHENLIHSHIEKIDHKCRFDNEIDYLVSQHKSLLQWLSQIGIIHSIFRNHNKTLSCYLCLCDLAISYEAIMTHIYKDQHVNNVAYFNRFLGSVKSMELPCVSVGEDNQGKPISPEQSTNQSSTCPSLEPTKQKRKKKQKIKPDDVITIETENTQKKSVPIKQSTTQSSSNCPSFKSIKEKCEEVEDSNACIRKSLRMGIVDESSVANKQQNTQSPDICLSENAAEQVVDTAITNNLTPSSKPTKQKRRKAKKIERNDIIIIQTEDTQEKSVLIKQSTAQSSSTCPSLKSIEEKREKVEEINACIIKLIRMGIVKESSTIDDTAITNNPNNKVPVQTDENSFNTPAIQTQESSKEVKKIQAKNESRKHKYTIREENNPVCLKLKENNFLNVKKYGFAWQYMDDENSPEQLPDGIEWFSNEDYLFCTICNCNISKSQSIDEHLVTVDHIVNGPKVIRYFRTDGIFTCDVCYCGDMEISDIRDHLKDLEHWKNKMMKTAINPELERTKLYQLTRKTA